MYNLFIRRIYLIDPIIKLSFSVPKWALGKSTIHTINQSRDFELVSIGFTDWVSRKLEIFFFTLGYPTSSLFNCIGYNYINSKLTRALAILFIMLDPQMYALDYSTTIEIVTPCTVKWANNDHADFIDWFYFKSS